MLMLHPRHGAAQRRARARDGHRHSRQYGDEHAAEFPARRQERRHETFDDFSFDGQ
jgi:hypothetical protein